MTVGQAFGVALGLVFAVHGYIFIAWRSTARDRTASILGVVLTALSVSILIGSGTFLLWLREPNALVAVGMGIFTYASAFRAGFMEWSHLDHVPALSTINLMFRIYFWGNVVAACLCGVGCVIYGGPLGVLGACVSLSWTLMNLLFLKRITSDQARDEGA